MGHRVWTPRIQVKKLICLRIRLACIPLWRWDTFPFKNNSCVCDVYLCISLCAYAHVCGTCVEVRGQPWVSPSLPLGLRQALCCWILRMPASLMLCLLSHCDDRISAMFGLICGLGIQTQVTLFVGENPLSNESPSKSIISTDFKY